MNQIRAIVLGSLLAVAGAAPLLAQTSPTPTEPTETEINNIGNEEILRLLALAKLAKEGVSAPTDLQLAEAKATLTTQRTSGMGWGAMANAMGLRLGEVISAAKRTTPDKPQAATSKSGNATSGGANASNGGSRGNSGSNSGGGSGGNSGGNGKR
jgi:hypothetical protein